MDLKIFALIMLNVASLSCGQLLLKLGMADVGAVSVRSAGDLVSLPLVLVRSRWLLLGVLLLAVQFYAYLTLLSWADLSFVLPLNALSFVVAAGLAQLLLYENVTPTRWAGTLLICAGVWLIASGEPRTQPPEGFRAATAATSDRLAPPS